MDKFNDYTGYNGEGNSTIPQYEGFNPEAAYNVQGYENNTEYNSQEYNNANYTAYNDTEYENYNNVQNITGYGNYNNGQNNSSGYDNYNNAGYETSEVLNYTEADNYDTTDYNNYEYDSDYVAPNYDGVRLMDVAANNPEASTVTASSDNLTDSLFEPLYPEEYAPIPEATSVFQPEPRTQQRNDEALTEAELADLKRQKERARRKKLAARERRRRERRKQAIIRCSILLIIVVLLIVGLVALISGIAKSAKEKKKQKELSEYYATSEITTEEPVANIDEAIVAKEIPTDRDAALVILRKQAENDSTIQSICDSAAAMPDILLQHLAVNTELKDFTLSYPAKINIVFDGNFELDVPTDEVPLFLQYDEQWGYADYSKDILALRGAGPACLSMAYTYLMKDGGQNPIRVADYATEHGYLDEDGKTHWSLMIDGANDLGLKSSDLTIDKDEMINALRGGKLLICKVSEGDFTTEESFIVIREFKKGFFYVNDPNSKARSEVGWDFKRLRGQIEKMCVLEAGEKTAPEDNTEENTQEGNNPVENQPESTPESPETGNAE